MVERWSFDGLQGENIRPDAKPKAYLHLNQYDQVVQAAIEGHGVALERMALVLPMLKDGRLVALADHGFGNCDYVYWLVDESPSQRSEVEELRNWIIKEAQASDAELKERTARSTRPA